MAQMYLLLQLSVALTLLAAFSQALNIPNPPTSRPSTGVRPGWNPLWGVGPVNLPSKMAIADSPAPSVVNTNAKSAGPA
ncbi:hypothetical protein B0H34DRAFT_690927, partial [Crassisporium funariophilum]